MEEPKTLVLPKGRLVYDDPIKSAAPPYEPGDPECPDRVSISRSSSHYYPMIGLYLGVRINGEERKDVVEYCASEGWAKIGEKDDKGDIKTDWKGNPKSTTKYDVHVAPYWKERPSRQVRRAMLRAGK